MTRCGVILPGGTAGEQLEQAFLAEWSGWDGVFVWEAAYGVDAWAPLAAMAAATPRVRLGTMLTLLPWRRPWKAASQVVAAGCAWWMESRWDMPHHSPERMRLIRERVAAGPPRCTA
jgi:hypothetical protein